MNAKVKNIVVRVNLKELGIIKKKANEKGLPMSTFLRLLALKE